ncbi:MAG: sporulation protein YqfD [Oscillospiraceae bacterium]|jgi:similar to stage IV sporulation protein|nr:sporulation protein YqfD [Oscillospiraceae bacterium]
MLIIRLLRFFRGYVRFRATEGFPERFLNLCNRQCIPVWDVLFRGGALAGCTSIRGYKAMHACAARSGAVLGIEKKCGLPFLLHTYRRRAGLLLGLALFLCGLRLLSGMVWSIDVTGNQAVPKEQILAALTAQGLRQGVAVKRLDAKRMGEDALMALPELSWLSLNIRGSTALIEVRERLPEADRTAPAPQNIVAAKAGQLAVLEVYTGKPQAKAGQAVPEGALLAAGMVENLDGSVRLVAASAYAVARTPLSLEVRLPRAAAAGTPVRTRTRYTLHLLWLRIPLGPAPKAQEGDIRLNSSQVWAPTGKAMPLAIERQTLLQMATAEGERTDERLALAATEHFFDTAFRALRGVQVLERAVSISITPEECRVRLEGAAYENIGKAVLIE